jgi:ribosome recycling factor
MAMQAEFDLKKVAKEAEDKMKKSVDKCRENMQTLRTG